MTTPYSASVSISAREVAGPWAVASGRVAAAVAVLTVILVWYLASRALIPSTMVRMSLAAAAVAWLPAFGLGGRTVALGRRHRNDTDSLTGLPGRRYFVRTASRWLGGGHRAGGPPSAALILIDLDRLRDINGALGHEQGDRLLASVSARLSSVIRPTDLLARVDGDEFALLLPGTDLSGAEGVVRRIREALRLPVELDDLPVQADVSIGIAHAPEHGRGVQDLMGRAEAAMYEAKRSRSGQRVYGPDCQLGNRTRLGLRADLREALDDGQIELRYQPKADMRSGRISGVEALVRWRHPTDGVRPPDMFLPEMERAGLMGRLTQRVLDIALADCARWHRAGAELAVSVNVPASVIVDPGFVDLVRRSLRRHGLPAAALVVEVTEDGLITVLEKAQRTLAGLRDHGVRVSLDDYGTGLCSLAYLRELPADEVKLDQRFLRDIDRDTSAAAIVRSTVSLAHALQLRIVAEGVETSQSWHHLAEWQCDEVQGYFISRPLGGERVLSWLREWGDRFRRLPSPGEAPATGPINVGSVTQGPLGDRPDAHGAVAPVAGPGAVAPIGSGATTAGGRRSTPRRGARAALGAPVASPRPVLAVPAATGPLWQAGVRSPSSSSRGERGNPRRPAQPVQDGRMAG
ncbi:putative bifunctional diguanylate cyclase/phosphodiesterase [Parafrankia discariae]|uniref:putative bifunctional diguanylate cyclase/phosphodiesterase n=1 Tax=Parafrankia discariae TaxID=365528 RepID=UPI001E2E48F0|nr:bifunctional diguanylate cyclase/phosphodiesterase [Parafrankia discariae]